MFIAVIFFVVIFLASALGVLVALKISTAKNEYSPPKNANEINEINIEESNVDFEPSGTPVCDKKTSEGNFSCLSKIDKTASLSDYMVEVENIDEEEYNEKLRQSQEDKYKRKKQEG